MNHQGISFPENGFGIVIGTGLMMVGIPKLWWYALTAITASLGRQSRENVDLQALFL